MHVDVSACVVPEKNAQPKTDAPAATCVVEWDTKNGQGSILTDGDNLRCWAFKSTRNLNANTRDPKPET